VPRTRASCACWEIYDEHAGLQDRFRLCGQVSRELAPEARNHWVARASGVAQDLRCDFPIAAYASLACAGRRATTATSPRVAVRFA
jgi:Ni,Fe-hydrogenase III large subunit